MHQNITEASRLNSILDLVFSDEEDLVGDVKVEAGIGTSDHVMVKFNIQIAYKTKDNPDLVPNFSKADFGKIRFELGNMDWATELSCLDVEDAWNFFKAKLYHT